MQLQSTNIHSDRIEFLYLNSATGITTNIMMKQSKERNGDLKAELREVTQRTTMSPTKIRSTLLLLWFHSYFIFIQFSHSKVGMTLPYMQYMAVQEIVYLIVSK